MPTWTYEARSVDGELVTGRLQAASREAVLSHLRGRGLAAVRLGEVRQTLLGRRVGTAHRANMFRGLSDLLAAGVPLLRSLRLLAKGKANPALSRILGDVSDDVADGMHLADAMEARPEAFGAIHVAMVRAGEQGGFLPEVLAELAALLEQQATLRSRVVGNLIYPAILVLTGIGAVVYALVAFVPKFEPYMERIEVPAATEILLALSSFLIGWWPLILAVLICSVISASVLRRRPAVQFTIGALSLRVPVLAPLIVDLSMARFGRMMSSLLESGIGLLPALEIAKSSCGQPQLEEAVAAAASAVREGESLAMPLAQSGVLTADVVEMIEVAEAANALPRVMLQIADGSERRLSRRLDLLMRLMEPILLLIIAAMIVFIFIALVLPMMKMGSAVG